MASLTWEEVEAMDIAVPDEATKRPNKRQTLVRISGIANAFEASLLSGALDDEGIAHAIEEHVETAHAALFTLSRSWGSVVVPSEFGQRALDILQEIRDEFSQTETDEEE